MYKIGYELNGSKDVFEFAAYEPARNKFRAIIYANAKLLLDCNGIWEDKHHIDETANEWSAVTAPPNLFITLYGDTPSEDANILQECKKREGIASKKRKAEQL